MKKTFAWVILLVSLLIAACEKNGYYDNPNARLQFSKDTISFDTLFTTLGSVTLNFRVYNPYNRDVEISEVYLAGGAGSPFRLNVDGFDGGDAKRVTDISIRSRDSMYVFVEVTLNQNNSNFPYMFTDSVIFVTNGNVQKVKLIAYGQDVYHIRITNFSEYVVLNEEQNIRALLLKTTTFNNDKPYLIHDHLLIDSGETLTLKPGVIFYMRKNTSIFVGGTLKIMGTLDEPVEIRGDRLDDIFDGLPYDQVPGQWGYIRLLVGSKNNEINYASIRNAIIGVQVDSVVTPDVPALKISNSRIQNMTSTGLFAQGAHVEADNCLFANCGQYNIALTLGGKYSFTHCTVGNFYGTKTYFDAANRTTPAVVLNNFYIDNNKQVQLRNLKQADFRNCIIYGPLQAEIGLANEVEDKPVDATFNYYFDHCLIKGGTKLDTADVQHFKNIIWDKNPMFIQPWGILDFRIDSLSPARNIANPDYSNQYEYDIMGNSRFNDGAPDLGAFEFVPRSKN